MLQLWEKLNPDTGYSREEISKIAQENGISDYTVGNLLNARRKYLSFRKDTQRYYRSDVGSSPSLPVSDDETIAPTTAATQSPSTQSPSTKTTKTKAASSKTAPQSTKSKPKSVNPKAKASKSSSSVKKSPVADPVETTPAIAKSTEPAARSPELEGLANIAINADAIAQKIRESLSRLQTAKARKETVATERQQLEIEETHLETEITNLENSLQNIQLFL